MLIATVPAIYVSAIPVAKVIHGWLVASNAPARVISVICLVVGILVTNAAMGTIAPEKNHRFIRAFVFATEEHRASWKGTNKCWWLVLPVKSVWLRCVDQQLGFAVENKKK